MKPNGYKKNIKQTMPNKTFVYWMAGLGLSLFCTFAGADEVLGHISDETEPKSTLHSPAEDHANSDRKIIYRVICSPEDEQLPDCEKPFHDVESISQPLDETENLQENQGVNSTKNGDIDEYAEKKSTSEIIKSQSKSKVTTKKIPVTKKSKQLAKVAAPSKKNAKQVKKTVSKKGESKK